MPHSDIPGSKLVCSSPRLFAAYCVLHRLLAPRHSPCALSSLTIGIETDALRPAMNGPRQFLFPPSLKNTACVICGSEKTTVCRIFSCQRTAGGLRPAGPPRAVARGDPAIPTPLQRGAPSGAPNLPSTHAPVRRPMESISKLFYRSFRLRGTLASLAASARPAFRACRAGARLVWLVHATRRRSEGWWRIPVSNR